MGGFYTIKLYQLSHDYENGTDYACYCFVPKSIGTNQGKEEVENKKKKRGQWRWSACFFGDVLSIDRIYSSARVATHVTIISMSVLSSSLAGHTLTLSVERGSITMKLQFGGDKAGDYRLGWLPPISADAAAAADVVVEEGLIIIYTTFILQYDDRVKERKDFIWFYCLHNWIGLIVVNNNLIT